MSTAGRPAGPNFGRVVQEARKAMGGFGSLSAIPVAITFLGFTSYSLYHSVYFVPGGYRAVKFNALLGLQERVFDEGANVAIPFLETPILFDTRSRPIELASSSGSRDLQIINMAVRVLYKPEVSKLPTIYRTLGVNYAETVLPSIIHEVVKAAIAHYNASELLVKRSEVSAEVHRELVQRAAHFNVTITDVSITQMAFGKEYTAAVEAKQVAQQMAERGKFRVEQALEEKKSTILLAEGEAESASLIGAAMKNNPSFLKLREVEAAKDIAKTIKEGRGQYVVTADSLLLGSLGASGAAAKA